MVHLEVSWWLTGVLLSSSYLGPHRSPSLVSPYANELYRARPDLVSECSIKLDSGWWMSTNHSKQTIGQIIAMACDVAQVAHGRDLVASLGD